MFLLRQLASTRFSRYLKLAFLFWDLVLLNAAYLISLLIRFGHLSGINGQEVKTIFLVSNGLWIALVLYHDAYKIIRVEPIEAVLSRTLKLILIHAGIIAVFVVTLKYGQISRLRMLYFYLVFFALVFVSRIIFLKILKVARSKGFNYRNVLIVGANATGNRMAKILSKDLSYGYHVIGFVDDSVEEKVELKAPYLGNLTDIEKFIVNKSIDELYVALHINNADQISQLIQICERYMVRIKFIPDFQQYTKTRKVIIDFYENTPVLMLRKEPLELATNRLVKKLFDVVFSLMVIVLIFSWLFPILIILIKSSSKGPIFYKQIRSGENNKHFICFKFRSMKAGNGGFVQATKNDPRITRIGAFMRKTNLDELPQFFNVLIGQMSVVGPRPHPVELDEQFKSLVRGYLVRHYAKPGITGWAQVMGYRGETKTTEAMKKRVEFDVWYIENWSFLLDLKIIFRTCRNMIRGEKNAY